jgi:hypothetical protein
MKRHNRKRIGHYHGRLEYTKLIRVIKFLLILIFSSLTSLCQQNIKFNNSLFKINLTSTIDVFSFPTLQASYERQLSDNISISSEFGYQFYNLPINNLISDTSFVSPNGFKTALEIRYYNLFKKHKLLNEKGSTLSGLYLGLNIFYKQNRNNAEINYYPKNITTDYHDCFWIKKRNWGCNFVLGSQKYISNKIILDMYVGLGFMQRTLYDFNKEFNNKNDSLIVGRHNVFGAGKGNLSENNGWTGNLTCGLRIAIKLN